MKKNIFLLAGVLLVVAGLNAHAADLRVKGTIAPASCSFTLTNAVIDYGRIDPNSLSYTNSTKLAAKSTPFAVKCGSNVKTKVAVKGIDNRATSRIPNLLIPHYGPGYPDEWNFGLGTTAKGQKVGGYVVFMRNTVADGVAVSPLGSHNNGLSWGRSHGTIAHTTFISSWGATTPVALNVLSGNLVVEAVINKTSELDMNSQISLDGQATLELRYL